jgi:tRNA threonylcarbamoyladenosine biosynthesis protein TsaB
MRTLAIDTSGRACSLALFDDDRLIAEFHEEIGRGHAERLIPELRRLPDGGRADNILVGCGPGSFTGLRVGIAAARGLGLGWGVAVKGMNSLALIALAGPEATPCTVAIEGGHGEIFVQAFDAPPLTERGAVRSLSPEAAARECADNLVYGSAAKLLVTARGSGTATSAQPRAALALNLQAALRNLPPSPIYGRAPDAKPMPT